MSTLKIETKVTGSVEAHVVFELDQPIVLTADGTGKGSTDLINVRDGILNLEFVGQGLRGTDWTLKVNQIEPTAKLLFDHSGTIGKSGLTMLTNAVLI